MAYCAEADLDAAFTSKTITQWTLDDPKSAGPRNAAIVAAALTDADAEIDESLRDVYTIPLAVVPASVKTISIWFALYRLNSRRGGGLDPTVMLRYQEAKQRLAAIRSGAVTLDPPAATDGALLRSTTDGLEPVFTRSARRTDGGVAEDRRSGSMDVW